MGALGPGPSRAPKPGNGDERRDPSTSIDIPLRQGTIPIPRPRDQGAPKFGVHSGPEVTRMCLPLPPVRPLLSTVLRGCASPLHRCLSPRRSKVLRDCAPPLSRRLALSPRRFSVSFDPRTPLEPSVPSDPTSLGVFGQVASCSLPRCPQAPGASLIRAVTSATHLPHPLVIFKTFLSPLVSLRVLPTWKKEGTV